VKEFEARREGALLLYRFSNGAFVNIDYFKPSKPDHHNFWLMDVPFSRGIRKFTGLNYK
jgi:hypothetical protein